MYIKFNLTSENILIMARTKDFKLFQQTKSRLMLGEWCDRSKATHKTLIMVVDDGRKMKRATCELLNIASFLSSAMSRLVVTSWSVKLCVRVVHRCRLLRRYIEGERVVRRCADIALRLKTCTRVFLPEAEDEGQARRICSKIRNKVGYKTHMPLSNPYVRPICQAHVCPIKGLFSGLWNIKYRTISSFVLCREQSVLSREPLYARLTPGSRVWSVQSGDKHRTALFIWSEPISARPCWIHTPSDGRPLS